MTYPFPKSKLIQNRLIAISSGIIYYVSCCNKLYEAKYDKHSFDNVCNMTNISKHFIGSLMAAASPCFLLIKFQFQTNLELGIWCSDTIRDTGTCLCEIDKFFLPIFYWVLKISKWNYFNPFFEGQVCKGII